MGLRSSLKTAGDCPSFRSRFEIVSYQLQSDGVRRRVTSQALAEYS